MSTRLYTADDVLRLADDGFRYELERGELVRLSPAGGTHGIIVSRFIRMLGAYIEHHELDHEVLNDVLMSVSPPNEAETAKAPDIMVVDSQRLPQGKALRGALNAGQLVPLLAVEVHSPNDDLAYAAHKIKLYLQAGMREVWYVKPDECEVEIYTDSVRPPQIVRLPHPVSSTALPGCEISLQRLFRGL